jgi:nitrogen fixation protein NifU and related proteins
VNLKDLYRDVILDHNRSPRNFGTLPPPVRTAEGHNPLCGDRLALYVDVDQDRIRDLKFDGQGCAISMASASLMTEAVKGRSRAEATQLIEAVHDLLTGAARAPDASLGKLAALSGVQEFPARVKCASLSWHTLKAALDAPGGSVSTE